MTDTTRPEWMPSGEMPEAVRTAIHRMRWIADHNCGAYFQEWGKPVREAADALESWWRTHAQPVAEGGMTDEMAAVLSYTETLADLRYGHGQCELAEKMRTQADAVRAQAAAQPVRLVKVRKGIESVLRAFTAEHLNKVSATDCGTQLLAALAELDAVEGVKG